MKKIFFTCLLMVFTTFVFSQPRNMRLGLSLEPLSVSWMSSNTPNIESGGYNGSTSIYIKAEYYFSPFVSLATGVGMTFNQGGTLIYQTGGDVWKDSDLIPATLHFLPSNSELKSKIQYLEIPVALKLRTDEFSSFRVFFEVPRLTLGVTTKARGSVSAMGISEENQNIYPSMSWLNASYGVMAGIEYSLSEDISAVIGVNWKQGFVDITDDSGIDAKSTTGTLGLHVGILF